MRHIKSFCLLNESKSGLSGDLLRALSDYYNTGDHWSNGAVEKREAELVRKYPDEKEIIGEIFADIGDLANLYSDFYDKKGGIKETDLSVAYNEIVRKINVRL